MSEKRKFCEIPDSQWNDIYIIKPKDGQVVASKIKGEGKGYHGATPFINGYFETHEDLRNRFELIRWKHDLWLPLEK
jgi:hypothetical protein